MSRRPLAAAVEVRSRKALARQNPATDTRAADIVEWYRNALEHAAPPTGLVWDPIRVGPTWRWENGWVLPEVTLGWARLAWAGMWLRDSSGQEWQYTLEQARFLLWYHALDEDLDFAYPNGALQRLKGWGKDPVAVAESSCAILGPSKVDRVEGGEVYGTDEADAWVQVLAVTKDQTWNTFQLFPTMIPADTRRHYGVQIGKENVWALGDSRRVQAVAGNVAAVEGGRPTFVVRSETQEWKANNQGHAMAAALDGNATKAPTETEFTRARPARMLDIFNAYRPGEDSVAERTRDAYELTQATDGIEEFGLLYDSLEAPEDAPLTITDAPAVVESIRGDSVWLDPKRIVKSIKDPRNLPSESRRKWYNQIRSPEDAWIKLDRWDLCGNHRSLIAGERILMFGDGSKSDDATALVGVAESDGYVFTIGVWQRPPNLRTRPDEPGWTVDRGEVDWRVREMIARYDVIGFWWDPSNARDDETGERFWEPLCDAWQELLLARNPRAGSKAIELWAVKDGPNRHAVIWDMRNPMHVKAHTEAAERFVSDVLEGLLMHDKNKLLRAHVGNAKRRPGPFGIGLGKDGRESARKVDGAVCAVGARMMLRVWAAIRPHKRKRSGKVW